MKRITLLFSLTILAALSFLKAGAQELTDSLVLELGRPVIFERGRTVISPEDKAWIQDSLKAQLSDSTLLRLYVRAAASPEGYRENNERLSKNRFYAVNKFLKEYGIPADKVSVQTVTEDYDLLRAMMARANDADLHIMDSLMEKCGGNEVKLKHELIVYNKGTMWRRLYKQYFPELRAVRLVLFRGDAVEKKMAEAQEPEVTVEEPVQPVEEQPVVEEPKVEEVNEIPAVPATPVQPIVEKDNEPREPMLSVKSNVLYDLAFMPKLGYSPIVNVEAEYYFHNSHYAILGEYEFPWWSHDSKHHYFQCLNWQLEGRRYFTKDPVKTGHYLSVYGNAGYWDFSFNAKDAWQGEGWGAGLGYGYVMRLGKESRWKLEFLIKGGYYQAKYDPYDAGDPYKGKYYYEWDDDPAKFKRRNHRFRWFGPTGLGVTLSYDLMYRRAKDGKVTWNKLFKSK